MPLDIKDLLRFADVILQSLQNAKPSPRLAVPEEDFLRYRQAAEKLLAAYKCTLEDRTRWSLRRELEEVADAFDAMLVKSNTKKATTTQQRAVVNAALLRARMRRTHYAAYIAGAACARSQLEPHFKAWLLNIAASGSIALCDALEIISVHSSDATHVVEEFRLGAEEDAFGFLKEAARLHRRCWLSNYNTARLLLMSNADQSIGQRAEGLVQQVEMPTSNTPGWELQWHADNWNCFTSPGDEKIWQKLAPPRFSCVQHHFRSASETAQVILQDRGSAFPPAPGTPSSYGRSAKAAIVTAILIGALTGIRWMIDDQSAAAFIQHLPDLVGYTSDAMGIGDGGLALVSQGDGGLARAWHGDGGLA